MADITVKVAKDIDKSDATAEGIEKRWKDEFMKLLFGGAMPK